MVQAAGGRAVDPSGCHVVFELPRLTWETRIRFWDNDRGLAARMLVNEPCPFWGSSALVAPLLPHPREHRVRPTMRRAGALSGCPPASSTTCRKTPRPHIRLGLYALALNGMGLAGFCCLPCTFDLSIRCARHRADHQQGRPTPSRRHSCWAIDAGPLIVAMYWSVRAPNDLRSAGMASGTT